MNKKMIMERTLQEMEIMRSNVCPVCKKQGAPVKNITVKHLVLDEFIEEVGDHDYNLCMNEVCETAYYQTEPKKMFTKDQLNVPLWFKKDAHPKFACYCSKVTEEQVIHAVLENGAKNMKEVLKITGAMSNSECSKKNPFGKCCHQIIQEAMDKALTLKPEEISMDNI